MIMDAKRAVLLLALLAAVCSAQSANDGQTITVRVRWNATSNELRVHEDDSFGDIAALVTTNFSYFQTGWDIVDGEMNSSFAIVSEAQRLVAYRAVGFGEGFLNSVRIFQNYNNSFFGPDGSLATLESRPEIVPWIERHYQYLKNRSFVGDDIGRQLSGLLALIDGLAEGYAAANTDPAKTLNSTQFFWLNFQAEIGDIQTAYTTDEDVSLWQALPHLDPRNKARHCSALVKVLPDDVYFSHVTWSSFNSMMRQYKTYRFEGRAVSMSGYPGVIHSIDDWYMTSNRLAVMETTNGVYNVSLFQNFVKPGYRTISEFLRVMIANFLAVDAPSWVRYFSTENSGTYNNQWMVFDMKLFTPADTNTSTLPTLPPNSFWVAEQLPGSEAPYGVTSADMTDHLNQMSYWASYNIPYFPSVFNVSENLEQQLEFGNFYSYTNYSRAEIFRRNESDVKDLESMKAMMRYNNYEHDPYSLISNCKAASNGVCNPKYSAMLSIASRGDLNPPGGAANYGVNYRFLTQRNHCGTDAKIAVWSKMINATASVYDLSVPFTGVIINGPTAYQQPVFQWSTSPFANRTDIVREGLPDRFAFPFLSVTALMPPALQPAAVPASDSKHAVAIGLGVTASFLTAAIVLSLVLRTRAKTRDASEQANLLDKA